MRRCSLETCICHLETPRPHAGVSTLAFIPLRPRDPSWGPGMFTELRTHVSRGAPKGQCSLRSAAEILPRLPLALETGFRGLGYLLPLGSWP